MADVLKTTNLMLFQLGKLLHEWQRIEGNLFHLYTVREQQFSNQRLLATTFHHIRSFETKLGLTDKVLKDHLEGGLLTKWREELFKPLSTASQVRNNIVHGELNYDSDNEAIITPFWTDTQRFDGGKQPYVYSLKDLYKTHTEWFNLVSTMIDFWEEIDPQPFVQATRKARLEKSASPPSGTPSPSENK
jgi:hypothetical protein